MSRILSAAGLLVLTALGCVPAQAERPRFLCRKMQGRDRRGGAGVHCNDKSFTEVPEGNHNGRPYGHFSRKCDFPNVLNHECDPGSRFKVLQDDDNVAMVAHCRKESAKAGDPTFGDIAVIQYNKKNGATCFYQQLDDPKNPKHNVRLQADVKAPEDGGAIWYSPARHRGHQMRRVP